MSEVWAQTREGGKVNCKCQSTFEVRLARAEDYRTFKRILDVGRHPAFIGRDNFETNSRNGGALFYFFQEQPIAVSLINPHYGILLALNVHPGHRSHGLGAAVVSFLMPNFARVIEQRVPWFEKQGYVKIGKLKKGVTLKTQVMARAQLFKLAGRLQKLVRNNYRHRLGQGVNSNHESPTSDTLSKMVRPDRHRRKGVRISVENRVLAQASGGSAI